MSCWRVLYNGASHGRRWQVSLQPLYGWSFFTWRQPWPPVGRNRTAEQPPCFHTWRIGPLTLSRFTRRPPWS